jgi:YegS/Rv2252/BmrU family lipid kinase
MVGRVKVALIANPTAGSGAGGRIGQKAHRTLEERGASVTLHETRAPGDATRFARAAREDGVDSIGVVGGDGTLNEVVQAYVDSGGRPLTGPALAVVPAGTGSDFQKTLGIGPRVEDAVERLLGSERRPIDLGILELTAHDGARVVRAFLNITSFGLGGLTDRIVNQGPKWLGGKTAFYFGAVRALVAYRNAPVRVRVDGEVFVEAPIVNVAIANGRYFGGGMLVAPDADPSDGAFDVISMADMDKVATLALTGSIYSGAHLSRPGVSVARGAVVEAEPLVPSADVLIDMDGETPGRLPLVARIARGALVFHA